jgi:hypothetical protein
MGVPATEPDIVPEGVPAETDETVPAGVPADEVEVSATDAVVTFAVPDTWYCETLPILPVPKTLALRNLCGPAAGSWMGVSWLCAASGEPEKLWLWGANAARLTEPEKKPVGVPADAGAVDAPGVPVNKACWIVPEGRNVSDPPVKEPVLN